ncbi:MAG: PD-(D/E)XK nuclease family protein [Acidimicrobiales bacterium]|nr:PD-(D/E)XK nuclease family protein [Acidimicrobiales bacterium]
MSDLTVCSTPYGLPALELLRDLVADAKGGEPLAPVTVVVSANSVAVATRRRLADGGLGPVSGTGAGIAGVTFVTAYRVAELLGAPALAAEGRRPVSTPVVAGAVRAVLRDSPGVFAAVIDHPTTERALVAAHRELSDLDGPALDALARQSVRAADVVRLHRSVRQALAASWYDEQDLVESALSQIGAGGPIEAVTGPVIVHLPQRLSRAQGRLLRSLASQRPCTVVVGVTGVPEADEPVVRTIGRLGATIPKARPPAPVVAQGVCVSDPDDEVRQVVRGIVDAARSGVPLERMAVVWGVADPYARLVHDHLGAAGIAVNGAAVASVAQRLLGRSLLQLLSLPERGLRRDDVLELVSSAPVRWHGHLAPARAWEVLSRRAGVVAGSSQWVERLDRLTAELEAARDRVVGDDADDDAGERRRRRIDTDLGHLAGLRAFVERLAADLAEGAGRSRWAELVTWCRRIIARYLGPEEARRGWPEPEQRAAEVVERALDRLASLDSVDPEPDLGVFRRTLAAELDAGLGRVGRFGHGVLVGRTAMVTGLAIDRLWILGTSEGQLPGRSREDSLLPDRERAVAGDLLLRAGRVADEHHHFLAALASCSGPVTFLRSRGDLRVTTERVASRWTPPEVLAAETEVASFVNGLERAEFPATGQEHDLRVLLGAHRAGGVPDHHPLIRHDPRFARSVELVRSRASSGFTRFDGNLGGLGLDLGAPTGSTQVVSATRLETWADCPHRFFVRYLLGVEPIERPEDRFELHPLDRGSLVHDVLDAFVAEAIERHGGRVPPDVEWDGSDLERLHRLAAAAFARVEGQGLTGAPLYWRRDQRRILNDLTAWCVLDNEHRRVERRGPVATELSFGFDGGPSAVDVELSDGRRLRLRGSIDRLDVRDDGGLVVTDYKTGRDPGSLGTDPVLRGTRLQLPLYALAARQLRDDPDAPVASRYWYITAAAGFSVRELPITDEAASRVDDVLRRICDGIEAGVFCSHPVVTTRPAFVPCEFCDPDGLGVNHLRRAFVRKASAPALTGYVELVEPELLEPVRNGDAGDRS